MTLVINLLSYNTPHCKSTRTVLVKSYIINIKRTDTDENLSCKVLCTCDRMV